MFAIYDTDVYEQYEVRQVFVDNKEITACVWMAEREPNHMHMVWLQLVSPSSS